MTKYWLELSLQTISHKCWFLYPYSGGEWMKHSDFPEGRRPSTRPSIPHLLSTAYQLDEVCFCSSAYQADEWCEEHPAKLPPATRSVADHVLDVLVKPLGSCGYVGKCYHGDHCNGEQNPVKWELIGRSLIARQARQTNVISCARGACLI